MKKILAMFVAAMAVLSFTYRPLYCATEDLDAFLAAKNAYKVYKYKNNRQALSIAYANIELAIEQNPKESNFYLLAGKILLSMKNNLAAPSLALDNFEKAISLNPKDSVLYYSIGQELYINDRPIDALEYYEKALLMNKKLMSPQYVALLAEIYFETGHTQRGIEFFKELISQNKNSPVYLILTAAYLMQYDCLFDEAKSYLNLILKSKKYSQQDKERAQEMLEEIEE